jgi:hypothetical protein
MGKHSVTIEAIAYATRGAEMFPPEPIDFLYGPAYSPQRVLRGLSFSDAFRTNIGLVNTGAEDATFALALQRLPYRNLAVAHIRVPAYGLVHASVQALFPLLTGGDDFSVLVETSSPDTHVYASVIENKTNRARFVSQSVGTQ